MDDNEVAKYWDENAAQWVRGVRAGWDLHRDYLNNPVFLSMLPDLTEARVLDIGCGEGTNTRIFTELCDSMVGVDVSEKMVTAARQAEIDDPLGIEYHTTSGNDLGLFEADSFDAVLSTMAMMDMADYKGCVQEVSRVLRPGGLFQFSVTHPCFMTRLWKRIKTENGQDAVIAGDYFGLEATDEDNGVDEWFFGAAPVEERAKARPFRVPNFFRTLSEYFNSLVEAGFDVVELNEPCAGIGAAERHEYTDDTRIVPLFIIFQCRKR